ncbi:hypothetical protein QFZ62_000558 [Clavibacter sp. B3I6]|uniref:hypothetical protein n=1 Tax=Clavibacter sp. B3I6 TaxID=3042268 RepID=UPI00277D4A00|nr:hypothetical protein [Clavibacter sp. B3I6]MDQ0743250.1 hypothetical protein [Clavibacter sp. B3I6]
MTPSHDAPDTGPTSFDDGPAPATLGLSRREMRAAERARAQALGIDEADDAPADAPAPDGEPAAAIASEQAAVADGPQQGESPASVSAHDAGSARPTVEETAPAATPASTGVGPETSAILLSGGVLTRRQLRAIREAEEAARQQRGHEHGDDAADRTGAATEQPTTDQPPRQQPGPEERPADARPAVDDAPPAAAASSDGDVPPYVRYGRGSRATPRPRAPYGSAYRRTPAADVAETAPATGTVDAPGTAVASDTEDADATSTTEAADEPAAEETTAVEPESASATPPSAEMAPAETPSAWPFAPIVPSGDASDRDVDSSGEQPTVPPLAAHAPSREEDPRPAPAFQPVPWTTGAAAPTLEPAFGTRAAAAAEEPHGDDADDRTPAAVRTAAEAPVADVRTPFTPPTGHWSVQDQVDEDQPHTGNHFILPSVPHSADMQQALNSTGEIIITGSIDLPRSLGSMGTHPDRFDTADMDRMLEGDDHDHAHAGSDSEPVRASRAVSTHTSTRAVVQPPPRKRFTAPVVAAVTAGGVAVIGAGLVVVAFMTNVF